MNARMLSTHAAEGSGTLFRQLHRREPVLAGFAVVLAALMIPSLAGLLIDTRTFNGINVWIKPLKFQSSAVIYLVTLAWFWPYLDTDQRGRKAVRFAAWFIGGVLLYEILYITYRASLAEASHFNRTSALTIALYALMGIMITASTAVTGWIGWLILKGRDTAASPAMRYAIGTGLMAGTILGGLTAMYMSSHSGHWVGGQATDANGSFFFHWSRSGGDLRVSHFFGLHAMQGIPLIGWLVSGYAPGTARALINGSLLLWTAVTLALFVQALMGLPLFPA